MDTKLCDFCNAPNPTWMVPVAPFNFLGGRSVDEWLACTPCADLVRAGLWNRLLARVIEAWDRQHDTPMNAEMIEIMRTTYKKLRKNVDGPPVRLL
ncbi:hypothetical protein SEA_CIRCINUS_95 [Streptomyces phage Circinus]|uniref:Uncharacterized protein n=1 Tax=Streptomyces phage Circinus TaxID=2562189 RepID=A0A4D6E2T2_9CAUD|nr:hypothetical protein SEA_CIRCINUS_95 [Streptomyces phage Circinus]